LFFYIGASSCTIDGAHYYGISDTKGKHHENPIWEMAKSSNLLCSQCHRDNHKSPSSID
jgi:hypothetical protein